jgi:hypothetical protein
MIDRHNMVQWRVIKAIMEYRNLQYEGRHENKTISLSKYEVLNQVSMSSYNRLRADLFFWTADE